MLRVLGQRFPQEVDAAVAKMSRSVAKAKAAALRIGPQSDDDDDNQAAVRRETALREEALSSLLVSTFAGAELAQRLPLQQEQQQGEDVSASVVESRGISKLLKCFCLSFLSCRGRPPAHAIPVRVNVLMNSPT